MIRPFASPTFPGRIVPLLALMAALSCSSSFAQAPHPHAHTPKTETPHSPQPTTLSDTRIHWPGWQQVTDVLFLREYHTRMVILGTMILGTAAGTVGTFMLLRKRSLIGDVVSHASFPGIAAAFLLTEALLPGRGRSLPLLLTGALLAGLAGALATAGISRLTRIKHDAAMAIVLSVTFGIGISLFTLIQKIPAGNVAGLQQFIYGQTATLSLSDIRVISIGAATVLLASCLFFKEFTLLCFDEDFTTSQGWPTYQIDIALMVLVVTISIIGLQSVGLLLIVAMLIIPPASARFWSDRLAPMTLTAACLGGGAAYLGAAASSLFARFSAGAVIVLVSFLLFLLSMLLGRQRGIVQRLIAQRTTRQRVGRHDLLRAIYELLEPTMTETWSQANEPLLEQTVSLKDLLRSRSWSASRLQRLLTHARRQRLLIHESSDYRLTTTGAAQARTVVRNHRLWETYLILHADIAPSHVDRDADDIEHVLAPDLIEELVSAVSHRYPDQAMPPSPHPLPPAHS